MCQVLPTPHARETQGQPGYGLGKVGDTETAEGRHSQLNLWGWTWGPNTRGISEADPINTQHLMNPGKLKSGSCVGLPVEHGQ